MATTWNNEIKRQTGNTLTLVNDTVVTVNSATSLVGGANPPTNWSFINKTS